MTDITEADMRALMEWIADEASTAHYLPTLNGAIEPTIEGALTECRQLADALHRIGAAIHPEQWTDPPETHP